MAAHSSKQQQLLLRLLVVAILSAAHAAIQPNPDCPKTCGSVHIPFPFGTTKDCALDSSFLIDCNKTSSGSNSPTPFLPQTSYRVLNISLLDGELRIVSPVGRVCSYLNGTRMSRDPKEFNLTHFSISWSQNMLTAVGCNTGGLLIGVDPENGKNYTTACVSLCYRPDDAINGSCTGTGCCQIPMPTQRFSRVYYHPTGGFVGVGVFNFSRCGYGFLAEKGAYNFLSTDIGTGNLKHTRIPMVLDWAVGSQTCQEARKNASSYACKARHSECHNSTMRLGYLCNCSTGFQGNPYLLDGCQDVNECEEPNNCYSGGICQNFPGSYSCSCPEGYVGDGKNNGTKCSLKPSSISRTDTILIIALSVSVCVVALLMASFYVYLGIKKSKLIKLKEQFFKQNGGLLLQQKVAKHRGSTEIAKVFTMEELKKATNNFDESKILGRGGHGTVYKGQLVDNRTVAIKKSKISDPSQIEQFINEVVILSQINHRNVVKLLGCCLETEVPLLVYEFIPNGTISEHLHDHSQSLKLTWQTRLRIAAETAEALAYLHSATTPSIIHRDVKTANILLDHNMTAKVSDFGASRIVLLDQTQLTTLVQGTLGYLDPEYYHTSQLTEKSDVYSFGVVLVELLTGRKALSFALPEADRNLAVYFVSSLKEGHLLHIVDNHIIDEAKVEQLKKFANIAKQCLRVNRKERPTMKEVAMKLEGLIVEEKHRRESDKSSPEETQNLLKASSSSSSSVFHVENGTSGSGISSRCDSICQISMSLGGGR